jgi:hypothetical protein
MIRLPQLERFCSNLRITSKEKGVCPLFLYGTQRYLLQELSRLLNQGIHWIYVLKARQQGITTICLALDLYWLFINPGIQGTFVVEEESKLPNHRSTLDGFLKSLPPGMKIPTLVHNRKILEFKNRSKLIYQAAGVKVRAQKSTFGQSTGVNFVHGTEMSSWADFEATANFIGSLAETFEKRLYVFESTAKGYNDFHDRWIDAKNSLTKGNIFIGWWRMEPYSVSRDTLIFQIYGVDAPIGEELLWIDQVKDLYGFEIQPEQLAWWRWKLAEDIRDEQLMMQYYPPTEEHAFILSGYRFFDIERIREADKRTSNFTADFYRYRFGPTFEQTELMPSSEKNAHLTVWEERDQAGYYVVGADPAYGSSYESDRYCAQVFRCYTNRIVQVAEYCHPEGNTYSFAWILAHLAGYYRNEYIPTTLVIEINGPGKTVMDEFFRLQQYPTHTMPRAKPELANVIGGIQNYLYTRSDTVSGANYNYHWKTTSDLKEYIMNLYRDTFDSDKLEIRSAELLEEMRNIQQSSEGIQSATRTVHDDRVIATALGIEGWVKMLLPDLYAAGASWERAHLGKESQQPANVLSYSLENYLRALRQEEEELQ